jgi:hypothetical protein
VKSNPSKELWNKKIQESQQLRFVHFPEFSRCGRKQTGISPTASDGWFHFPFEFQRNGSNQHWQPLKTTRGVGKHSLNLLEWKHIWMKRSLENFEKFNRNARDLIIFVAISSRRVKTNHLKFMLRFMSRSQMEQSLAHSLRMPPMPFFIHRFNDPIANGVNILWTGYYDTSFAEPQNNQWVFGKYWGS